MMVSWKLGVGRSGVPLAAAIALVLVVAACATRPPLAREGEYTVSTEATVIERISPSEWMIEATGIFRSQLSPVFRARAEVNRVGTELALRDARKVVIWHVLFSGSDPFLNTPEERDRFHRAHEQFFEERNLARYISFEEVQFVNNIIIDDGAGRRLSKRFRVNTERLRQDLEEQRITATRAQVRAELGLPFIMVVPQALPGEDIFVRLSEPEMRHGATVVEAFLSSRRYDVLVPEQSAMVADLATETFRAAASPDRRSTEFSPDQAYLLALSIGSDIYITLDGRFENAANDTQRYAQQVRAFETTTGRLLGAETGFSQGRRGDSLVSVEEATNQAVDAVLSRINNYWEEDLERGVQYKLVLSIADVFNANEAERIQFAYLDAVEDMALAFRENIVTRKTLDYLLWVDPARFRSPTRVFQRVRQEFEGKLGFLLSAGAELRAVTTNRKLLLMRFDRS